VLVDERVRAFHRDAASGLERAGLLRLYLLRIAGRAAAAYYGFQAKRRSYAYLGGMDPAFAHASPGSLLLAHAMAEAASEGSTCFDFLRGAEAYKRDWGASQAPGCGAVLRRREAMDG
jgi:CelD/BcsL family acetyltransferase involved in cellulose biosynthesis